MRNRKTVRILGGRVSSDGKVTVTLQTPNQPKKPFVHHLVAATFLPNPKNKRCVGLH
jgi:hypothetical protein